MGTILSILLVLIFIIAILILAKLLNDERKRTLVLGVLLAGQADRNAALQLELLEYKLGRKS